MEVAVAYGAFEPHVAVIPHDALHIYRDLRMIIDYCAADMRLPAGSHSQPVCFYFPVGHLDRKCFFSDSNQGLGLPQACESELGFIEPVGKVGGPRLVAVEGWKTKQQEQ